MIRELARDNEFVIDVVDGFNVDEEDEKNEKEKKDDNIAIIYDKNDDR